MMNKIISLAIIFSICFFAHGVAQNNNATAQIINQNHNNVIAKGVLGTYATPPQLPNGQVDEQKLITQIRDIHANTYNWLIRAGSSDLDALKSFLPLARKAGLKIWITLLPPSEPPLSEPFRLDYDQWAVELAMLSKREPNLVAWSIDDFISNYNFFSPEYVKEFLRRAHAINPKFVFVPCVYFSNVTDYVVKNYAPLIGGILFPYMAETGGKNLKDPTLVASEIAKLRNMLGSGIPIILDVYASSHSSLGSTTPEYVKKVIDAGLKNADGVMIYTHQDPIKNAEKYKIIKKEFLKGFN